MTNKCVVCEKRGKPGGCLSFHRFPDNVQKRTAWLTALKMESAGRWHYVCSDHFKKNDYIVRKSGQRILNVNALPHLPTKPRLIEQKKVNRELFNLPEAISIPSTSKQEQSISMETSEETSETFIAIPHLQRFDNSSVTLLTDSEPSERTGTASEITMTASEIIASSKSTLTVSDSSSTITASEFGKSISNASSPRTPMSTLNNLEVLKSIAKDKRQIHSSSSSSLTVDINPKSITPEPTAPPKKRRKLTHKRYVGDITSSEFASPKKAKKAFNLAKTKITEYRKKIGVLQKRNRRMNCRVTNLKSLLNVLKQKHFLSENAQESIEAMLPGPASEMVKRILKGSKREQYSPTLRAFALTLHFYSPRAYNYVREKFNKSLPHPSTVSKWYQTINGSPGFTEESLNALKNKVNENNEKGKKTYCNLVMDEMSIRKKIEWVGDRFIGYVDIGAGVETDSLPEAKEVLVFLVTSINGHWKIPVGYFCLDGLSGSERANLVRQCLEFLHRSGIICTSLTFDGAASNISMANQLGANFSDPLNLKTYFDHSVTNEKVFIFLDICHMIKLIRNCLGDLKYLVSKNGNVISWNYFEELVSLQCNDGLNAGSKIKRRHMQYAKEKMRVKIATQTFSKSVSDALRFLEEDLNLNAFQGASETAKFCLLFNDVFDILNSRNLFSNYLYKKALSSETEDRFLNKFAELREYILGLTLNNKPVTSCPRKTGFLGFLVGMISFQGIYENYVKPDNKLSFLMGYKFSQDHLETLFSAVRSMHGFNNNPTCRQFQSAYKKLLVSREVRGADTANAVTLDNTLILHVSSRKITVNDDQEDLETSETYKKLCEDLDNHDYFSRSGWQLSSFVNDVIIYIAGFVVKSLHKCITCSKCLSLLETNESLSLLQKKKTFGNLIKASPFVTDICTWGEKMFRLMENKNMFTSKNDNLINIFIHKTIDILPTKVFTAFGNHIFDGDFLDNHQLSLIKLILKRYFTIRIHHETRKKSDNIKNRVRSILTHLILYQNQ